LISAAGPVFLLLWLSAGGMSPDDSMDLVRLSELEEILAESPGDIDASVACARVLHDLRRDKPALTVMESLPPESLDPGERLFLASMRAFDSDIPGAAAAAAPACLPAVVVLAAGSAPAVLLVLSRGGRRRGDA